jgi:L-fuconate dehydratase
MRIVREEIGPDLMLAVDANQRWDVPVAIDWMSRLAPFEPYWIEEPTSPDDILGHAAIARGVAPVRVATGEHVHNRVMFKQFLQAGAISVCQIDACRLAGVNEVVAVLLLAAKFGVPVCPHAGGVGLCELVQHLSAFDYIAVSGSMDARVIEYVDHLHEHFLDPVVIRGGRYMLPSQPGYSAEMRPESLARYRYPDGPEWAGEETELAAVTEGAP